MNSRVRKLLAGRKRRIERRLDKTRFAGSCPMLGASNIHYDVAGRTQAISAAQGRTVLSRLAGRSRAASATSAGSNLLRVEAFAAQAEGEFTAWRGMRSMIHAVRLVLPVVLTLGLWVPPVVPS